MNINIQKLNAFLSHLSKREKLVLYIALGVISLTILDRLIINPVLWRMKSLDAEIQEEKIQIKEDLHILAQEDRIIKESQEYKKYSAKDLSREEVTTLLLKEIGNLANETSVYLIDIKPTDIEEGEVFRKYYVTLSCEAQMEQIMNFIYNVESSNNLLRIEKYNISPKSEESSIARSSMTISKTSIP